MRERASDPRLRTDGESRLSADAGTISWRANRAQLPTPAIEGAIAVLLVLGVVAGFSLGVGPSGAREAQLDAYASDVATILANEPPQHRGGTRLSEVALSESALKRERETLERRVARILPANLLFHVETPHGRLGHPKPTGVPTGSATVTTITGDVTIRVWYA